MNSNEDIEWEIPTTESPHEPDPSGMNFEAIKTMMIGVDREEIWPIFAKNLRIIFDHIVDHMAKIPEISWEEHEYAEWLAEEYLGYIKTYHHDAAGVFNRKWKNVFAKYEIEDMNSRDQGGIVPVYLTICGHIEILKINNFPHPERVAQLENLRQLAETQFPFVRISDRKIIQKMLLRNYTPQAPPNISESSAAL